MQLKRGDVSQEGLDKAPFMLDSNTGNEGKRVLKRDEREYGHVSQCLLRSVFLLRRNTDW